MAGPKPDPKIQSLHRSHALHPHPERVQDAEFVTHPAFFDARDLVQVKYEMLRRARTGRLPVSEIARTFGLSRPVFYDAARAFAQHGMPGLLPERPGPRAPHKFTPEMLTFLANERRRDATVRPAELARRIEATFRVRVHPHSVARHLKAGDKKNTLRGPNARP